MIALWMTLLLAQQAPEAPARDDHGWIDFSRMEAEGRLGAVVFSSDFRSSPSVCGGLWARAPMPWLFSGTETNPEPFGIFSQIVTATVDRDLPSGAGSRSSGTLLFATLGMDFMIARESDFRFSAQAGIQYGFFGGVSLLDSGWASLVGVSGGLRLSRGLWATCTPQVTFGETGDRLFFLQVGLLWEF